MGVAGGYKCMKYTLVAFNTLVLGIGAAVLALGIYTAVTDYGAKEISSVISSDLYKAGSYLLIAVGSATIIIAFLGCAGAAMENRCLLGVYFAIMLLLTIFFLAITIIGFVFRNNLAGHIGRGVEDSLMKSYGKDKDFTDSWDQLQRKLKCCGFEGNVYSNTSWAIFRQTDWFKNQTGDRQFVPFSCCPKDANLDLCTNTDGRIPKAGPPATNQTATNDLLFKEGCYEKLQDYIDQNAAIIGGIALAALFIMIIGTIFSICLCVQIGRQGYVV
ncbi:tetraspanin-18-like [Littorina saxatilis]|uniref:Tetraspanin n=1 Tax=Littorina saxatilis TaxID=31220 RepID=A0AAN9GBW6_9CAEN